MLPLSPALKARLVPLLANGGDDGGFRRGVLQNLISKYDLDCKGRKKHSFLFITLLFFFAKCACPVKGQEKKENSGTGLTCNLTRYDMYAMINLYTS